MTGPVITRPWPPAPWRQTEMVSSDNNHHSLERQLIELRMAHADLDALLDHRVANPLPDELLLRRLKKRRLLLRDEIARIERVLTPQEPA